MAFATLGQYAVKHGLLKHVLVTLQDLVPINVNHISSYNDSYNYHKFHDSFSKSQNCFDCHYNHHM